jgi:hypothetical protein
VAAEAARRLAGATRGHPAAARHASRRCPELAVDDADEVAGDVVDLLAVQAVGRLREVPDVVVVAAHVGELVPRTGCCDVVSRTYG